MQSNINESIYRNSGRAQAVLAVATGFLSKRFVVQGLVAASCVTIAVMDYCLANSIDPLHKRLKDRCVEDTATNLSNLLYWMTVGGMVLMVCAFIKGYLNPVIKRDELELDRNGRDEYEKKVTPYALAANDGCDSLERFSKPQEDNRRVSRVDYERLKQNSGCEFTASSELNANNDVNYVLMLSAIVDKCNEKFCPNGESSFKVTNQGAILNVNSGLRCTISKIKRDNQIEWCVSFAPTGGRHSEDEEKEKFLENQNYANFQQYWSIPALHRHALYVVDELQRQLKEKGSEDKVVVAGASLGANVAAFVGLLKELPTFLFNPSYLSGYLQHVVRREKPNFEKWTKEVNPITGMPNLLQYTVAGDWVSDAQLVPIAATNMVSPTGIINSPIAKMTNGFRELLHLVGIRTRRSFGKVIRIDKEQYVRGNMQGVPERINFAKNFLNILVEKGYLVKDEDVEGIDRALENEEMGAQNYYDLVMKIEWTLNKQGVREKIKTKRGELAAKNYYDLYLNGVIKLPEDMPVLNAPPMVLYHQMLPDFFIPKTFQDSKETETLLWKLKGLL